MNIQRRYNGIVFNWIKNADADSPTHTHIQHVMDMCVCVGLDSTKIKIQNLENKQQINLNDY